MMKPFRLFLVVASSLWLVACASVPVEHEYAWSPSPNFGERRPNFVVIHQTDSASFERALDILTRPGSEVSAHYLIAADGRIVQLVDERQRAWHAGASWWGGQTDMNSASIGIELDHYGDAPFPQVQIDALLRLLKEIAARNPIPAANYLAHGDVAPGRKVDPNYLFPWHELAQAGFGLWCGEDEIAATEPIEDVEQGLAALGYDMRDADAATQAFLRHYRSSNEQRPLTETDRRALSCLLAKHRQD